LRAPRRAAYQEPVGIPLKVRQNRGMRGPGRAHGKATKTTPENPANPVQTGVKPALIWQQGRGDARAVPGQAPP